MTRNQAIAKGFQFTGYYERDEEKAKDHWAKIVSQGYKAVLVTIPDSPYSRGEIGRGWSVYAEKKYYLDAKAKEIQTLIKNFGPSFQLLLTKHAAEVEERKNMLNGWKDWLAKNGYPES